MSCFVDSEQACFAGSRLLLPEYHLEEAKELIKAAVESVKVGDLHDETTFVELMVSQQQYDRVQNYIHIAMEEEAIEIANDTTYGLQAFVSSTNLERTNRVAEQIVAGTFSKRVGHDVLF